MRVPPWVVCVLYFLFQEEKKNATEPLTPVVGDMCCDRGSIFFCWHPTAGLATFYFFFLFQMCGTIDYRLVFLVLFCFLFFFFLVCPPVDGGKIKACLMKLTALSHVFSFPYKNVQAAFGDRSSDIVS